MDEIKIAHVSNGITLATQATDNLRDLIIDGKFKTGERLPNEPELAEKLNISRSTLRSALDTLEKAGYIFRRRGIGTFVANILPSVNNLNINSGVTQLIHSSGAQPGLVELFATKRMASEHVANRLRIEEGSPIVAVERVRTANDRRVVFSVDYFPISIFQKVEPQPTIADLEQFLKERQSMYDFFTDMLSIRTDHAIAWIKPMNADNILAEKLMVLRGSGILLLEQVDYDKEDVPIALSEEYYVANAFSFTVYRTQI